MSPSLKIRSLILTGVFALAISASPLLAGDAMAMDVTNVAVETDPGMATVKVGISEGAESAAVSTFTLSDPDRVVVDLSLIHI